MTGATGHANDAVLRTPTAGPHLEARRLGHHTRISGKPMLDERGPARPRGLLVGIGGDQQVAGQTDPQPRQHLDREHHRRDSALHVTGASPVQQPIAHIGDERIRSPLVNRRRRHHVDVAVEDQRPPAPTPSHRSDQLRPPRKIQARRHQWLPGHRRRIRLPHVNRRPDATQPTPPGTPAAPPHRGRDPPHPAPSCRTRSTRAPAPQATRAPPQSRHRRAVQHPKAPSSAR